MIYKHGLRTRQSPMQKAIGFGEDVAKFVAGAKTVWETGKTIMGFAEAAAPYVSTAAAMLV